MYTWHVKVFLLVKLIIIAYLYSSVDMSLLLCNQNQHQTMFRHQNHQNLRNKNEEPIIIVSFFVHYLLLLSLYKQINKIRLCSENTL